MSSATQVMPFERLHAPEIHELNELFEGYTFKSLLAIGGMGAVYLAIQDCLERPVAVKILPRRYSRDAMFFDEFSNEAKLIARLNHHNLVAIYDFGVKGELPFLVMEYANGQPMDKLIQVELIPYDRAAKILLGLLEGVKHAHKRGIVHRDIKPANIILTIEGDVKLVDFGIAKQCGYIPYEEGDIVMGTAGFAAPEVTLSPDHIDIRSDIYAAGATLCQMITGFTPDDLTEKAMEKRHLLGPLYPVVYKSIRSDANLRYQTVLEFEEALKEALKPLEKQDMDQTQLLKMEVGQTGQTVDLFKNSPKESSEQRRLLLHQQTATAIDQKPVILGGRYTLTDCIRQGSRTMVYLAKDLEMERAVKIRLFFKSDVTIWGEQFLELLAKLLQIEHPNIAKVFDGGLYDAGAFLVYSWDYGQYEDNLLDLGNSYEAYYTLAYQILDALEVASHYGFYHHALNTLSVIRDDQDQGSDYMLMDVGVSEILQLIHDDKSTPPGVRHEWAAPEQFENNLQGEKSTVYGFSQLLLSVILKGHPLAEMSLEGIKKIYQEGFKWRVRDYKDDLPDAFCDWLDKLSEPALEDRFISIRAARKGMPEIPEAIRV